MRSSLRAVGTVALSILLALSLTGCSCGDGEDISMITPYVDETDMSWAGAFSSSDNCPWGFEHRGIDIFATGNLKPFQAVCSGRVDSVELWNTGLYWQVSVNIRFNSVYWVSYAFEPNSSVQSDGETQLANIVVWEGQTVSQGDIIGYLYTADTLDPQYAHVDFGLFKRGYRICPERYFTPEARDSILRLIHKEQPGWDMCYDGDGAGGASGDTTAPSNLSVLVNNGAASTSSPTVTLSIAATDNVAVTGYYISETSTTPSATAPDWTSVTSTTSYSADVPFGLSSGDGTKTIYVWFKDDAGNVSAPGTASITLASTFSMITPYKYGSGMASINQAFSSSASCPWGFKHLGIDFSPNGNFEPFQAVCSGLVEYIELSQLQETSNWQVGVGLKYNDTYSICYAFEPMSANESDGQTQLANIVVSVGQVISQGDIIGYLYTAHEEYAHVDFGLLKDWDRICPEPYFTSEARDSILSLIHVAWPGANMCY
jgi:hypothetical protein